MIHDKFDWYYDATKRFVSIERDFGNVLTENFVPGRILLGFVFWEEYIFFLEYFLTEIYLENYLYLAM